MMGEKFWKPTTCASDCAEKNHPGREHDEADIQVTTGDGPDDIVIDYWPRWAGPIRQAPRTLSFNGRIFDLKERR